MKNKIRTSPPETEKSYEPPCIEILEVIVERGFQDDYVNNHEEQTY